MHRRTLTAELRIGFDNVSDDSAFSDFEASGFRTGAWFEGVARVPSDVRPLYESMLHAFAHAARLEDSVGITLLNDHPSGNAEHKSYRDLYHQARRVAQALSEQGVTAGDKVVIVLPTGYDFVAAYFGTQLLRAVPVPAYPPDPARLEVNLKKLAHITRSSGAKVCITWRAISAVIGELALRAEGLRSILFVEQIASSPPLRSRFRASPQDLGLIQYTSGSTSNPKGVALTQHNLVCNLQAIGQAVQVTRDDVVVNWCPLYHDMGLIGSLQFAVYWRLPLVLMSPLAFLARPYRWLKAIHDYRGTLSPAPNFGYALCVKRVRPEQREGLDLSSWRLALNGAEPVSVPVMQSFVETYAPFGFDRKAVFPVYGLAESTVAVTFPDLDEPLVADMIDRNALASGEAKPSRSDDAVALASVGRPIPGTLLRIVDKNGERLRDRMVGHVVTKSPSVMGGYLGNEEATEQVLRDGWLWTGDLGYMLDGNLYITGRAKDLIIIRGRNYFAEDIEYQVEQVSGIRPGGCVAFGIYDDQESRERLVLVCETRVQDEQERTDLARAISKQILDATGLGADEIALVHPGTIPKTSSGKRQRARCREAYRANELRPGQTSKFRLAVVFVRSQAGMLALRARTLLGRDGGTA